MVDRRSWVRVTADLQKQKIIWEVFNKGKKPEKDDKAIHRKECGLNGLHEWKSARLWVSTSSYMDQVEVCEDIAD
tara:strand:- start:83 stop:307 length:225 start_codon:yes stop_codon:yes gene_type:complete